MSTYVLIGAQRDGTRIAVEARHETQTSDYTTTQHEQRTGPHARLALSVLGWYGLTSDPDTAGQVGNMLADITRPAGTLTHADIKRLAEIWDRWHLNDRRAACAHMELPDDPSYDARRDITCPETGYRYGHAWLVEPLPDGLWDEVRAILAKGEKLDN